MVAGGVMGMATVITCILGVVWGVQYHYPHLMMALCLAMQVSAIYVVVTWYKVGDLDPKFKGLLGWMSVQLFIMMVALNCYLFEWEAASVSGSSISGSGSFYSPP